MADLDAMGVAIAKADAENPRTGPLEGRGRRGEPL